jgi:hypothetical protein
MSIRKCDELGNKAIQADEEEKRCLSIYQDLEREYDRRNR